jgi:hypothetical protein
MRLSGLVLVRRAGRLARLAVAALAALGVAGPAFAQGRDIRCPEFPVPEGKLEWVAPNMRMNGIPMQIKELTTGLAPRQVLDFYKRTWGATPPYYHEYDTQDWKAIATLRQECFYTVQVKSAGRGGTTALLGVSTRPQGTVRGAGAGFPAMGGSRVVNDIDHYDGGKTGRTLLLGNSHSPEANAHFYRRTLAAEGWVPIVDRAVPTGRGMSHVLVLKRGHHETNMTISPGGEGSTVLATMVDRP